MEKENKQKLLKRCIIVSISVIVIPSLIIGMVILKQNIDRKKQIAEEEARIAAQVEVPDVKGMTINQADETLNNAGLKVKISDHYKRLTESSPNEFVVSSQYPSAKEKVDKNTEVELIFKELKVIESNNFYGMRFKKTIEEFCESYNENIETIYDTLQENKVAIALDELKKSDFSYFSTVSSTNLKEYIANKIGYSVTLFIENDSDYIVSACVSYNEKQVANADKMMTYTVQRIYPALIMSLTDDSYNTAIDNIKDYATKGQERHINVILNNNVAYHMVENNSVNMYYIYAMSEEKYNQIINGESESQVNSNDQQIIDDINNRISFFNSYYGYNFQPNDGQMQEIIEFYNLHKDTGDWGNEVLLQFLIQRGYVDKKDSSQKTDTSATQNNNSKSSNANKESNNNATSKEDEDIEANLNINLKSLIAKNETAKEIIEKYPTIFINVYVEGALVRKEQFEYYNGGKSVPDSISTQATILDYEKKPSEKRQVTITMDNTSTMIVRTTLFEGEMVFDKTGNYEIK